MRRVIILGLFVLISWQFFLLAPVMVSAAEPPQSLLFDKPKLQVSFPSLNFTDSEKIIAQGQGKLKYFAIPWIGEYISAAYRWGVGIAGVLAVIMVIVGGLTWMTAGGNSSQVETAKTYIIGALTGLVLALGSYTLLWIINPNLTQLSPLRVPVIEKLGLGDFCPMFVMASQSVYEVKEDGTRFVNADGTIDETKKLKSATTLDCGGRYYLADGGDNLCMGINTTKGYHEGCVSGALCLPVFDKVEVAKAQGLTKFEFDCKSSDAEKFCEDLSEDKIGELNFPNNQDTCDMANNVIAYQEISQNNNKQNGQCVYMNKSSPLILSIVTVGLSAITDDGCYWCPSDRFDEIAKSLADHGLTPGKNCTSELGDFLTDKFGAEGISELLSGEDKEACLARWCGDE